MTILTTDQIKSILFNAVGRGAETRNFSGYELRRAPGNSGISIGIAQWDFGGRWQNSDLATLYTQFNSWANQNGRNAFSKLSDLEDYLKHKSTDAQNRFNSARTADLNAYFSTPTGRAYVDQLETWSFTGIGGKFPIGGIEPFAKAAMGSAFISGLNADDTRVALAGLIDFFNRSPSLGTALLTKLPPGGTSLSAFQQLISTYSKDLSDSANNAMNTASLMNRLDADTTFLGQSWRSLTDPTLRSGRTSPEVLMLDAMMRDPKSANALLDRAAQGGSGTAVVLLATTGNKSSVWSEVPIVGMDRFGSLYMIGSDGNGYRRLVGESDWTPIQSSNPQGYGFNRNLRYENNAWRLSMVEGIDLELGNGPVATLTIGGQDVILDAANPGEYSFLSDGSLAYAETSSDGKQKFGVIFTGENATKTYQLTALDENQSAPELQQVSFGGGLTGNQSNGYRLTINDGKGTVTQTVVTPNTAQTDEGIVVSGYIKTEQVFVNGVLVLDRDTAVSISPFSGERSEIVDATLYTAAGEFSGHTQSTIVETSAGLQTNRLEVEYDRFDQITKTSLTERQPDNTLLTTVRNGVGDTLSSTSLQTFDDSSSIATTTYPGGRVEMLATDFEGTPYQSSITVPSANNGSTTEYYKYVDGKPVLSSKKIIESVTDATGTYTVETVITEAGTVRNKYDGDHQLVSSEPVHNGMATLISAINTTGADVIRNGSPLVDALALVNALRTGQPLPIVSSGLKLANSVNAFNGQSSVNLSGAASIVSGISSLQSLQHALETGDDFGAITAGAQTIQFGAQAYAVFASNNAGADAFANTFEPGSAISEISAAVPYLAIANDLAHGDYTGAAIAAVSMTVPVIGWAYAAFQVFSSFFGHSDPPPEPWGGASANWTGSSLTTKSWGANGGETTANAYMNQFIAQLDALAAREQAQNPSSPIGVVANRLPSFSYRYRSGFALNEIDPVTGVQRNAEVRYDLTGRPFNAAPGSEVGSQSFSERFIRDALARGAVAPLWEAQTAAAQTQTGDPQAGLTEEERAGRNGLLATKATGATQYWRPVALDLNGDGIQTTGGNQTVAFDVDDSGFLKNSAWLNGNDGFLVLDRNLNSQIDSGKELFSNGAVDISARGLAGLHWVDANYDGTIDANDAVWNELKVWQDANGDGQVQAGESQGLAALGISKLNYVMGTFEQNGITKQLASPDLQADTEGSRVNVVPEGIVVQTSQGNVSLLVTHIDDRSLLEANRDGVTTFEDIETIITSADLLANDTLAGFTGQNLSLTGVSNFTHGTGYLDSNGSIHYRPEANYFGAASFDYQISAPLGQTATATVDLNIQNVNDAPTATVDMANSAVLASDIDDPTGPFTYSVVQQPQQGAAQIGADGHFTYTNWYAPNTPGVQYGDGIFGAAGPTTNSDPFIVRVADAHGAYSDVTVNAVHQGSYSPSLGGGGGGGKKPIAIDLNGDGFQFTNVDDSNVFFDVNGDGWKEKTSWFSGADAFLVLDEKGDHNIDQVNEISFAKYKHGAQTDLEGLAAFDTNGDGKLTAEDKDWGKFGVWKDSNQNGITDAGEFYTLSEQGITAISLQSDGQFSVVNGQTVHGLGSITRQDGSTLAIADVTLSYSTKDVQMPTASGVSEIVQRSQFSASGEEIVGTADNDLILGKNGNNVIQAYGGDDVIFEDGGNDFIDAGDGNDIVYSGADNDVVLAGTGDDVVFAGMGDDLVLGGDGQDALFAEAGNDIVFGGDGNDLISGDAGNDLLSGDLGDDAIFGGTGNDALFGMDGNDQLSGDEGNDYLNGGAGNDTLDGGAGADTMLGGTGDDTYIVDNVNDVVTELENEGNDTVRASVSYQLGDNVENLTLVGADSINGTGNAGANTLIGNAGDNTLDGGAGSDHLFGGDGNDTYILRTGTGADTIQDTSGIDRILVRGNFSASDITLTRHDQDVIVGIKGSTDSFTITNWFSLVAGQASTGTIESIQFENGSPAIDASYIYGLLGNHAPTATADTVGIEEDALTAIGNVLTNDTDIDLPVDSRQHLTISNPGTYAGSYGQLQMGVDGAYTYVLDNSLQAVQALAVGQTLVETINYTVQDNAIDNKTATSTLTITIAGTNDAPVVTSAIADQQGREKQALSFTVPGNTFFDVDHGDVLTYNALLVNADGSTQALPSWLSFNAATRTFSGTPGGADGGSFVFSVTATDPYGASASTTVTVDIADEFAGTGDNLNVITGSWTNDTLNGTRRSETLIGNGGTDKLLAGEGDNTIISYGSDTLITAGAGNDVITSSYGNDTIDAGNGNNWINAGGGNNVVTAGNGNDTITTDWGNSTINAGGGANTIVANGNSTVAATSGAGDDIITTSYGNDTINAGDGNNRINAGGGDNVITAGSGNDTINTDWGNSTINAGDGNNTIVATGGNTSVTTGSGADVITTSFGNDVIDSGAGNDTISTGWGADTINAGAGDDTIRTGGGGDTLRGGLGNDTIIADQWSNDTYLFAAGDGQDSIADSGGQDTLVLENISSSQLWFTHTGNDLNVSVIGTTDSVTLKDWYSGYQYPGSQYHVEQIQTSDGKVLLDSQVQNLVDAMAAFAPPAAGQTTLTGTAATTLTPVIAANWQ